MTPNTTGRRPAGVFACITDPTDDDLIGAIDTTLSRFAEYHALQGAFGQRASNRPKGILIERHGIAAQAAFDTLRDHANKSAAKVTGLALQVTDAHVFSIAPTPLKWEGATGDELALECERCHGILGLPDPLIYDASGDGIRLLGRFLCVSRRPRIHIVR